MNRGSAPLWSDVKTGAGAARGPASSTFSSHFDQMAPAEWEIARRGGQFYGPRDRISRHPQGHVQLRMDMRLNDRPLLWWGQFSSLTWTQRALLHVIPLSWSQVTWLQSVSGTFRSSSPSLCLCLFLYGPLVASSLMQSPNYHSMHCQHPAFEWPDTTSSLSLSMSSVPASLFPFIHSLLFGSMCVSSEKL